MYLNRPTLFPITCLHISDTIAYKIKGYILLKIVGMEEVPGVTFVKLTHHLINTNLLVFHVQSSDTHHAKIKLR